MKHKIKILALLSIINLSLTGCDLFEDEKVTVPSKNREAVVTVRHDVTPDPKLAGQTVHVGAVQSISEWPQTGGNASHSLPNIKLPTNLSEAWRVDIGAGSGSDCRLLANVITNHSLVYSMDAAGRIVAVDANSGSIKWEKETTPEDLPGQALGGGIAYNGGKIFAATSFGEMITYDANNGKELWRKELGAPMRIAPTIAAGKLYIININNELLCLEPSTGGIKWRHSSIREATGILGAANPAVASGMVVAGFSSGEVQALNAQSGFSMWNDVITPPTHIDTVSAIADIRARPVIDGHTAYIISHAGRTTAYDLNTGYRQWVRNIGGIRTPAISNNNLFIITNQQEIVCLKANTGQIRWSAKLPQTKDEQTRWAGPVLSSQGLVLTGSNGFIIFINPKSGKVIRQIEVGEPIFLSPVIAKNTLYVLTESGTLVAYR